MRGPHRVVYSARQLLYAAETASRCCFCPVFLIPRPETADWVPPNHLSMCVGGDYTAAVAELPLLSSALEEYILLVVPPVSLAPGKKSPRAHRVMLEIAHETSRKKRG